MFSAVPALPSIVHAQETVTSLDLPDFDELANAAVANPATSSEELASIAMSRPDLRAAIIMHPACSESLRGWLLEHDSLARTAWEDEQRTKRPVPPPPDKPEFGPGLIMVVVGVVILVAFVGLKAFSPVAGSNRGDEGEGTVQTDVTGTSQTERVRPAPDSAISAQLIQSPSLNISCEISSTSASCSILERNYAEAGLPDCPDRLFSIVVEQETSLACGSEYLGSVGDSVTTLEYGMTVANDTVACESDTTGMTCWNQWTGHGFKISRASNVIF